MATGGGRSNVLVFGQNKSDPNFMADFCPSKVLTNKNEVSSMTAQFYFIKRSGSVACVHVDVVVDDEDEDEDED